MQFGPWPRLALGWVRAINSNIDRPTKHSLPLTMMTTFPLSGKRGDFMLMIEKNVLDSYRYY